MALGYQIISLIFLYIQGAVALESSYDAATEPWFPEALPNITVVVGSDVTFTCVVDSLGKYRVAWLQMDQNKILAIQYHTITRDPRIGITGINNRIWLLQIQNVQVADAGRYMCQVNTIPMKKNVGFLQVLETHKLEPSTNPSTDGLEINTSKKKDDPLTSTYASSDSLASSTDKTTEPWFPEAIPNITVVAGSDVTLPCVVDSLGKYKVAWCQIDQNKILTVNNHTVTRDPRISITAIDNRIWSLQIHNVQGADSGRYLCMVNTFLIKKNVGFLQVLVPPEIWVPDQQVGADFKTDVTLVCNVESNPKSVMYWKRDDGRQIIVSNTKYNSDVLDTGYKVQMKLIIKNLGSDDFGSYTCFAKNSLGHAEGNITLYEIHKLEPSTNPSTDGLKINASKTAEPWFPEAIPNITVFAGSDVTLPCVVDSLGKYWVQWLQMDQKKILSIKYHTVTRDPRISITGINNRIWSLQIQNVQVADSGRYLCQVNTIPMKKNFGFLQVLVPPKIWVPDQQVGAAIKTDVTLVCNIESYPKLVMYWKRNDGRPMIVSNSKYNSVVLETANNVQMRLVIKNLGTDDFGSYTCVAKNSVGQVEGNITLHEMPELETSTDGLAINTSKTPPNIWIPDPLVGAIIGEDVTLGCNVEFSLTTVKYWTRDHDGTILITNSKYNVNPIDMNSYGAHMRLIIKNLQPYDFGSYICVAKNSGGETKRTIMLYEKDEPLISTYASSDGLASTTEEKISEPHSLTQPSDFPSSSAKIAPNISILNQRVEESIGANVTLVCDLESNPQSETYWKRDGGGLMVISNTKYNSILIDTGLNKVQMRLIIKNLSPDDFGSYTCVAENSAGEAEGNIRLYEMDSSHTSIYTSSDSLASSTDENISDPHSSTQPSDLSSGADKIFPKIQIPNRWVRAAIGGKVTLRCNLKSNPKSVTYWKQEGGGFIIISNTKYSTSLMDTGIYKVQMSLIIKNLRHDDFGTYTCVAKNSVGEAEGSILLYEKLKPHSVGSESIAVESDGQDTEDSLT